MRCQSLLLPLAVCKLCCHFQTLMHSRTDSKRAKRSSLNENPGLQCNLSSTDVVGKGFVFDINVIHCRIYSDTDWPQATIPDDSCTLTCERTHDLLKLAATFADCQQWQQFFHTRCAAGAGSGRCSSTAEPVCSHSVRAHLM